MTPTWRERRSYVCRACGAPNTNSVVPDPCIGALPGVNSACCGHGNLRSCVVQLLAPFVESTLPYLLDDHEVTELPARAKKDRTRVVTLRGEEAREFMINCGGHPAPLLDHPEVEYLDGWIPKEEEK